MSRRSRESRFAMLDAAAAAVGLMCLAGCATHDAASAGEAPASQTRTASGSLRTALVATSNQFATRIDEPTKTIYAEGIDAVAKSGVVESASNVGDKAPEFTLLDASGQSVTLGSLLRDGPVVLVWYRGGWCPYCNLTLKAYQDVLPQIQAEGAQLVAISPELPTNALTTKEKNNLDFVVLTDLNNTVAKRYGVVFDLTDPVHANYNANFGLDAWNGQSGGQLPLAATYVIDADGVIRWAFLDPDYRERAEPADVLAALRSLDQ